MLGYDSHYAFKIMIKTSNTMEYIKLNIQNIKETSFELKIDVISVF